MNRLSRAEYNKAWQAKNKPYLSEYRKARREKRHKEGLCNWCGKNEHKKTSVLCEECTNKSVENRKKLAEKRTALGYCTQCLVNKAKLGKRLCQSCTDRKRLTPAQRRKRTYGLEPHEHRELLESQNNACAVWGDKDKKLNVDHCHTKGNVRGLLCSSCNNGLGRFKDNPEFLRAAANYLELNDEQDS